MNKSMFDEIFMDMTEEVRKISGNPSFEYPKSYKDFLPCFLDAGKGSRDDSEWCVGTGRWYIHEEMLTYKRLGFIGVPIAFLRDSGVIAIISTDISPDFESDHVFLLTPYNPYVTKEEIPILGDYTFEEFAEMAWNDVNPFD